MKRLLLIGLLALSPYAISAQDWSANPNQPSLLLFLEGNLKHTSLQSFGYAKTDDLTPRLSLNTFLELPASSRSSVILQVGGSYRGQERLDFTQIGRLSKTQWDISLGMGFRWSWNDKK